MTIGYVQGPAIPEPEADAESMRMALSLVRETLELMQGYRGEKKNRVLTVGDLEELGILKSDDVRNLPDKGVNV